MTTYAATAPQGGPDRPDFLAWINLLLMMISLALQLMAQGLPPYERAQPLYCYPDK